MLVNLFLFLSDGVHKIVIGTQDNVGNFRYVIGDGRREEPCLSRLTTGLYQTEDAYNVRTDSHVQKLISLVQNQNFEISHTLC